VRLWSWPNYGFLLQIEEEMAEQSLEHGKYRKRGLYVAPSQFLHQQFVEVLRYRGELRTLLNVC